MTSGTAIAAAAGTARTTMRQGPATVPATMAVPPVTAEMAGAATAGLTAVAAAAEVAGMAEPLGLGHLRVASGEAN